MHYYTHHIGDYKRDTSHLTLLEHGIYRQLLDLYYLTENPLDANALRLIGCRIDSEYETAKNILNEFFQKTDDGYIHGRCESEITRIYDKSDKARASAKARWAKASDANALQTHSEGNADGMLPNTHNPIPNNKNKNITPLALLTAMGVSEKISKDWIKVRKEKKQAITQTALDRILIESKKANLSLEQALQYSCENGWAGFKASWITKEETIVPAWKKNML